jgi:hypothetical protein
MDIFFAVRQKLRARWQLAAASFLMATIGSFAAIMIAHKSGLQTNGMRGERASDNATQVVRAGSDEANVPLSPTSMSKPSKGAENADGEPNLADSLANSVRAEKNKELFQKLAIDDARLDKLEEQRKRLPHAIGSTGEGLPLEPEGSNGVDDVRKQLSSALVNLLKLEKRENADDPEIIAVRKQITRLQAQVNRAAHNPKAGVRVRPVNRANNEVQLDQINAEISLCGAQIVADLQGLAQARRSEQEVETRNRAPEAPVNGVPPPPSRNLASYSRTGLIAVISIALGLVLSIGTVIISDRPNGSVQDEAMLQTLLPATAEYIGSIPRMKSS